MRQAHIGLSMRRALVALCAALLAVVLVAPAAQADPKPSVSEQVGQSIIFIRTIYKAYVQVPLKSGTVWTPEMSLTTTCTGYAVDANGSIATAGHCVNGKGDDISDAFREKTIELLKSEFSWTDAEATANYKVAVADKWPVSGSTTDSNATPSRAVAVQQPTGAGQVLTDWVDAEVVDFQDFDDGDNAVLRINSQSLVPLAISPNVPQPGQAIVAVGFPGAVRVVTDTSIIPQPSYKTGTVSSRQVTGSGVTKTEISAGMGHGMSGGPTVDADGNVIGTNSSVTTDETASFDFITDNIALRSYLESHGVQLAAPRGSESGSTKMSKWLWLGPLIGVVVLILLILLVVVLRRSRKRKAQNRFGQPSGPGGPGQFGPGPGGPQQGPGQFGPGPQRNFGPPPGQFGGARPGGQQFGGPQQGGQPMSRPGAGPGGPGANNVPGGFGGPAPQRQPQPFAPNPQQQRPPQQGPGPNPYPPQGPPQNPGQNPYPPNPFR